VKTSTTILYVLPILYTYVTVVVHYTYKTRWVIQASGGSYVHIRFLNFTIITLLTKGYEKISTVLIFYAG
jgi:hypothetical protein